VLRRRNRGGRRLWPSGETANGGGEAHLQNLWGRGCGSKEGRITLIFQTRNSTCGHAITFVGTRPCASTTGKGVMGDSPFGIKLGKKAPLERTHQREEGGKEILNLFTVQGLTIGGNNRGQTWKPFSSNRTEKTSRGQGLSDFTRRKEERELAWTTQVHGCILGGQRAEGVWINREKKAHGKRPVH